MNLRVKRPIVSKISFWGKLPPYLKLLLKIAFSTVAVTIVLNKIDTQEVVKILPKLNVIWLLGAVLTFNLSQIVSALRMKKILEEIHLKASAWYHTKLFYFGMLYNLVLPGGVGGDASKVIVLKRTFQEKTKTIIKAAFLDRLSGLVAILALLCGLIIIIQPFNHPFIIYGLLCVAIAIYPLYYVFNKLFFHLFAPGFYTVNLFAMTVQALQLVCVICILHSLHIESHELNYLLVFLLSSIATIVPITVGGLGMREAVFLYASNWLVFDKEMAITLTLLFFIITAFSSLLGLFVSFNKRATEIQTNFNV